MERSKKQSHPGGISPAIAIVALVVLAAAIFGEELISRRLSLGMSETSERLGWWDVAFAVFEHVLILAAALIPIRLVLGRLRASDLGLRRVPWRPAVASAVAVYAAYVLVAAIAFAILGAPPERASADTFADSDWAGPLITYALIACVVAPPTEELFFRGLMFGAFRRRLRPLPAVVCGGVLFGVAHGPPLAGMLDLALLGIALCFLYERTGSLLPCIGVHAAHNAIAFGAIVSLPFPATALLTTVGVTLATGVSWALSTSASERAIRRVQVAM